MLYIKFLLLQVVIFRPGDILNQKMTKHVPVADRISFQSTSNEMLTILTKMASQNAGYHIDSIIQVSSFHLARTIASDMIGIAILGNKN